MQNQSPEKMEPACVFNSLTKVQAEDDARSQEGSNGLCQGIHGQLDPRLPGHEAHGKGDSRVQMGTCEIGHG